MEVSVRPYCETDIPEMIRIWNEVVEEGVAFPQEEYLNEKSGAKFFSAQSHCAVAENKKEGKILGMYILHPNNVGRCGHICNASYAVKKEIRGQHIGEKLVLHCLGKAKELGFRVLQFNAVVKSNKPALYLYEKLGFVRLGTIPGGFLMKDGTYEDIIPHYYVL